LRPTLFVGGVLVLLAAMLTTRAGLSIWVALFGVAALVGVHPRYWAAAGGWWGWAAAWVGLCAVSGFWSADLGQWRKAVGVQAPLVVFSLASAFFPLLAAKHARLLVGGTLTLLSAGIAYSLTLFAADSARVIQGYGVSHAMRTPLFNTHIHFSAVVACGVALGWMGWPLARTRAARIALLLTLAGMVIYLHVLASKTGLVMVYTFAALLIGRAAVRRGQWWKALLGLVFAVSAAWIAVQTVPTLRAKVAYVTWTIDQARAGERSGRYSDIGRALSYTVAARLIAQNPLFGVGAGDIKASMSNGYRQWQPAVAPENHLIPHNQWLSTAVAAGIPAVVLFCGWWLWPLRRRAGRGRAAFGELCVWTMLCVPLLVEPFLEVQAGVSVYLFSLLAARVLSRALSSEPVAEATAASRP